MKKAIFLSLFITFLANCRTDNQIKQMLIGSWQGSSWTVGSKDVGRNASSVVFEFKTDDTYTAKFEGQTEQGKFRILDNLLYTTAAETNKIEKMVRIDVVTQDSFVMIMNRAGDPEKLTLRKIK